MSERYKVVYVQRDSGERHYFVQGPDYHSPSRLPEGWALCMRDKLEAEFELAALRAQLSEAREALESIVTTREKFPGVVVPATLMRSFVKRVERVILGFDAAKLPSSKKQGGE